MTTDSSLANPARVAVVTGAARGIGDGCERSTTAQATPEL
jgi:NADP-dependent 3-hydroxy acid dehydrogenase YdfG